MALADFLGQFLGNFTQNLGSQANQLSAFDMLGPQGVEQQQENLRQKAQFAQQLNLHNTMTPYEQQSLTLQSNAQQFNQSNSRDNVNQSVYNALFGGGVLSTQGDPKAIQFGRGPNARYIVPPEKPAPLAPFNYKPTPEDIKNHPWMGQYGGNGITMDAKEFPAFMKDMQGLDKNNPQNTIAYESTLQDQLSKLIPNQSSGKPDPSLQTYQFLVHDALNPSDGSPPDHKRALAVIDNIRKRQDELSLAKQKQDLEQSPSSITFAAQKAGAEQSARGAADARTAAANLPDSTLNYWWKQVKSGAINYGDVLSRFDKAGKERFANYVAGIGDPTPVALDQSTRTRLQALEPVIGSLEDLRQKLSVGGLDKSEAPGSLLGARTLYGLGVGDDTGGLISQLEMDRLRGAAQALPGGRAALQTFEQAQIHTPNAWKDSGKLAADKLDTMLNYLHNQRESMYKYGAKSGIVQGQNSLGGGTPDLIIKDGKVIVNPAAQVGR